MKTEKRLELAREVKGNIRNAKYWLESSRPYRAFHYLMLADEANEGLVIEFEKAKGEVPIESLEKV